MIPQVTEYFLEGPSEFWVIGDESETVAGFMSMSGNKIEALFMAPEYQRRGGGREFLKHAQARHPELTVDVNEQNLAAIAFYRAAGFAIEGRSEYDEQGRPYPLLHMRLAR